MEEGHTTIRMPLTPPSLNQLGFQSGAWQKGYREKKKWQGNLEKEIMLTQMPRNLERLSASAALSFTYHRNRDEGNYRAFLEKCLGDALVNGGWLPDDTPERFRFYSVSFISSGVKSPETLIVMAWAK